jgi:transcription-repair coupling factor (superfamily II helicase)
VQASVAEARNLVEQGYRVVFFAKSIGELERLADIFQEYSVPFQLGLDPADATRPYLAERSYIAGATASTLLVKGHVRRGVVFPEARIAVIGSEDLFDTSDLVAQPPASKSQLAAFAADLADLKPGDYVSWVRARSHKAKPKATSCCWNTRPRPSSTFRSRAWI